MAGNNLPALGVRQRPPGDRHVAIAADGASAGRTTGIGVDDRGRRDLGRTGAGVRDPAVGVVDSRTSHLERGCGAVRLDLAAGVVDGPPGCDRGVALGLDQPCHVAQGAAGLHGDGTACGNGSTRVVHAAARHRHLAIAADQAALGVGERLGCTHAGGLRAGVLDGPAGIGDGTRRYGQRAACRNGTARVVQRALVRDGDALRAHVAARAVVERCDVECGLRLRRELAALVRHGTGLDVQRAVRCNRPAVVGQACGRYRQRAGTGIGDRAVVVDQRCGRQGQIRAVGLDGAAGVVERAGHADRDRPRSGLRDAAAAVEEIGRGERKLVAGEGARAVVERGGSDRRLLPRRDRAAGVGQRRPGGERGIAVGGQRAGIGQGLGGADAQVLHGADAAGIAQLAGLHGHVAVAADRAALAVGEPPGARQVQAIGIERRDVASRVVQAARVGIECSGRLQGAALVGERARDVGRQRILRNDLAALVGQAAGGHGRGALAGEMAAVVDQRALGVGAQRPARARCRTGQVQIAGLGVQIQVAVGRGLAAGKIDARTLQGRVAAGHVLAGRGHRSAGNHGEVARMRERAVAVDAGTQRPAGGDVVRVEAQVLLRGERAAIRQVTGRADRDGLPAVGGAGVIDAALGGHGQVAARVGLAGEHQFALRRQRQIPRLGRRHAAQGDTNAFLGRGQQNFVGIHAAQLAHVDAVGGRGAVPGNRRRAEGATVDLVRASHHVELVGVHGSVDRHRPRNQVHLVDVAGVQARALHRDLPTGHAVGIQAAATAENGHPGRQRRPARIDEAPAVDQDAVRVGDHHFRTRSGHLQIPLQGTRRRAGDLVDDDARRTAGQQVRVAVDVAGQLRLRDAGGVVQDGSLTGNVELRIGIERNTASVRTCDVDLLQSVLRLDDMGARPRGRDDLGLHRIGQAQRAPCPEHHRQHGEARGGGGRCGRRAGLPAGLTPLAGASRRFLYGHQHAAYSVENGSIALRVHDNPDFVISTKTGILSALYCTK
ncbi:hypothetical protein GO306_04323 [Ralstonia solanacearum]|nr:hypothetical protein [Ralstonia solanacearum]NKA50948.1 hypothetical protein [Ralstonia solanacearum]